METFYTDKSKKFTCNLEIDGASIDETFARLSLSFDNDKTNTKFVYDGTINEDGKITVKIPRIKNAPSMEGTATLEVIAESTFFEAWEGDFKIKRHKNVSVKKINEDTDDDDDGIKINVIKEDSDPEEENINKKKKQKIVEDNKSDDSVDKIFGLLEKLYKLDEEKPVIKNKVSDRIKGLVNEEVSDFDFLSMGKIKKEDNERNVFSSKEFQTNFVKDVVNKNNNNVEIISNKFIEDDDHPLSDIMDSGYVELEIELKYHFNGNEYKMDLMIEGDKIYPEDKKDFSNYEFKVFNNNGQQVKFDWIKKNPKLYNAFISRLVLPNLK